MIVDEVDGHSRLNHLKVNLNTEKSPSDMRRLALTPTPGMKKS